MSMMDDQYTRILITRFSLGRKSRFVCDSAAADAERVFKRTFLVCLEQNNLSLLFLDVFRSLTENLQGSPVAPFPLPGPQRSSSITARLKRRG